MNESHTQNNDREQEKATEFPHPWELGGGATFDPPDSSLADEFDAKNHNSPGL